MQTKKIGRPQKPEKERINLTIDKNVLEQLRNFAKNNQKNIGEVAEESLRQYMKLPETFEDRQTIKLKNGAYSKIPFIQLDNEEQKCINEPGIMLLAVDNKTKIIASINLAPKDFQGDRWIFGVQAIEKMNNFSHHYRMKRIYFGIMSEEFQFYHFMPYTDKNMPQIDAILTEEMIRRYKSR